MLMCWLSVNTPVYWYVDALVECGHACRSGDLAVNSSSELIDLYDKLDGVQSMLAWTEAVGQMAWFLGKRLYLLYPVI